MQVGPSELSGGCCAGPQVVAGALEGPRLSRLDDRQVGDGGCSGWKGISRGDLWKTRGRRSSGRTNGQWLARSAALGKQEG